jgi:hypothetical protein
VRKLPPGAKPMPGGPPGGPALGDVLGQMQKGSFFRLRRESNATQPPRLPGAAAGGGGEGAALDGAAKEVESARERMARKVGGPAPGAGPKVVGGGGNFMAEWKAKREGAGAAQPSGEAATEEEEKKAADVTSSAPEAAAKQAEDAPAEPVAAATDSAAAQ